MMESEYVRRSVGQALALGLAEVVAVRPADPVEYLALWLLQHKRNLGEREQVSAALQHGVNKERILESPEGRQEEEEGEEETGSGGAATEDIEAEQSPPSASDAVSSSHVTPPLSASAQGRGDSKLSSITELEEQENQ